LRWLALALLNAPSPAGAAEAGRSEGPEPAGKAEEGAALFSEDDLALLTFEISGHQLADSMNAYVTRGGVFLPLGELARSLDLAISVDADHGLAEGWVINESRLFQLDLTEMKARVAGVETRLARTEVAVWEGDIYLRSDVLEKLLPLRLRADVRAMALIGTASEPLPFESRLQRELLRKKMSGQAQGAQTGVIVPAPYALFTPPAVTVNANLSNDSGRGVDRKIDAAISGDLLHSSLRAFLSTDENTRPNSLRLSLERRDPDGNAVGFGGVTRIGVGDVYTPPLQLGPAGRGGRGVFLSSEPLERAGVFDRIDINGELPSAYDVELYVNEVLTAAQTGAGDGRYRFTDVGLIYGLNILRLVFYGPNGERREETRRINVGSGALAPGETRFSMGVVQDGMPLVSFGGSDGSAGAPVSRHQLRLSARIAHGLSRATTLVGGVSRYQPGDAPSRGLLSAGLITSVRGVAIQAISGADSSGGRALSTAVAGRPLGIGVQLRHAEYSGGFVDETQIGSSGGDVRRATHVNVDVQPRLAGFSLPISADFSLISSGGGQSQRSLGLRTSKSLGGVLVSTAFNLDENRSPGSRARTAKMALDLSTLIPGQWQLRGRLDTSASPRFQLSSIGGTIQKNSDRLAFSLSGQHNFGRQQGTLFTAGLTLRTGRGDVAMNAGYETSQRQLRLGLRLSTGVLFDPLAGRYRVSGPSAATGGAAAIDAFVDRNGNGLRDEGDDPVPNLLVSGGRDTVVTNAEGRTLVTGLSDAVRGHIRFDASELDDPYVVGPAPSLRLMPHAGRTIVLPYAMTATAEVELSALTQGSGSAKGRPLAALSIELIDATGKVAHGGRTEYDGTLLLQQVRPGSYHIRIEPDQAARLGLRLHGTPRLDISPKGGLLSQKLTVTFNGRPQAMVEPKWRPEADTPAALRARPVLRGKKGAKPRGALSARMDGGWRAARGTPSLVRSI